MTAVNPNFDRDAFLQDCRTVYRLWKGAAEWWHIDMPDSLQMGSPVSFEDEMAERIYVMLVSTWQALASYEPLDQTFSDAGAHLHITRIDGKITAQWKSTSETLGLRDILIQEASTCGLFDGTSALLLVDIIIWMMFDGSLPIRSWQRDPASSTVCLIYIDKEYPLLTD